MFVLCFSVKFHSLYFFPYKGLSFKEAQCEGACLGYVAVLSGDSEEFCMEYMLQNVLFQSNRCLCLPSIILSEEGPGLLGPGLRDGGIWTGLQGGPVFHRVDTVMATTKLS